jgi:uncharacterized membrane protein
VQASVLPVCLSVVVFAFGPLFESWQPARPGPIAFAAALGFFGSGVAYVLWSYGIARVPAARAGVYTNLVPVVALLIAWLGLGESLTARQTLGGAVVIAGAVLASTRATAAVALAVLALVLAGCGGRREPSASDVVREWSAAIQADDNERAASLFAGDASIVQGDQLTTLRTHADALRWNARLPCAGRVVALKQRGSSAEATFRLGDRRHHHPCADPPGAEAIAVFVVEGGKIVLWAQIGSQVALSH